MSKSPILLTLEVPKENKIIDFNKVVNEPRYINGRVWCNPPYSNPAPWLHKAYEEVKVLGNCELAVVLCKFDCTTKMFQEFFPLIDELVLLTGRRIRFIGRWQKPDGTLTTNTVSRDSHCLFVFKR